MKVKELIEELKTWPFPDAEVILMDAGGWKYGITGMCMKDTDNLLIQLFTIETEEEGE
jgi:hypothetical protein